MKGVANLLICASILIVGNAQKFDESDSRYKFLEVPLNDAKNGIVNDDPSLAPIICAAEGSNGALIAHEDCSKFYICSNGRRIAMKCPPNLLYNPLKEQCDWPANVMCPIRNPDNEIEGDDESNNEDVDDENYDPNKAFEVCSAEGSNGILVAHRYCNRFIECSNRLRIEHRCPPALLFNTRLNKCDWSSNVNCGNRIIPELESSNVADNIKDKEVNSDPSKAIEICATEGSDGILVAHEYCNQFYKCSQGIPVALQCQLNLLYNPKNEQCDWPHNVNCDGRIIPEPDTEDNDDDSSDNGGVNSDPSKAAEICSVKGSDGVLVAHEYCNKFYKCSHGVPVALKCQLNLLYNPQKEQCDWPQNVDCNGRIL